jgi:hypothetical protein
MKLSRLILFCLSAAIFTGIVVTATGCFGTGTMDGSLSLNISDQPLWGPSGYDRVQYYYIPDVDSYYSVSERQYIYRDGSEWRHSASLPSRYVNYDPYHSYKVVINEEKPYLNNARHQEQFRGMKGKTDQQVIRDSHERRYVERKDHPEHDKWEKDHGH